MPKRRILVDFEEDTKPKRQKKFAVSVDSNLTNTDLGKEIADYLNKEHSNITIELPGGFELRGQDLILDTIRDDEVIIARVLSTNDDRAKRNSIQTLISRHPPVQQGNEPHRIQICLVTAQEARGHARSVLKDSSTTINGVFAFDGAFISGNTTLATVRREAGRVLGWISEDEITDEDNQDSCDYPHDKGIACSCALALQIERQGLFSTLHCRFSLDGQSCSHLDCPYSHANLKADDSKTPPHCIICSEFLGFPCPACIQDDVHPDDIPNCPLVQNAGCGHLHHAHCLRMNSGGAPLSKAGCPSGCPSSTFPREAAIFDHPSPLIVVAWDGDKIDYVPINAPQTDVIPLRLTSEDVVNLIRSFLTSKGFALPGLFLRIHSRDALSETVQFTQSTLVSVCHGSTHNVYQSYHRFEVFPNQTSSLSVPLPSKGGIHVDLHTPECPIIACGCISLQNLFSEVSQRDKTKVVLYAVKRALEDGKEASKPSTVSRELSYLSSPSWQPSVPQSPRGMAALLSSLYCLTKSVSLKGIGTERRVLSMLHQITYFPPAVRALGILFLNRNVAPEECSALSEALYHLLKDFLSNARSATAITTNSNRFFEAVRILLSHIISAAGNIQPPEPETQIQRPLNEISLVCTNSYKVLSNPILVDSQVLDRHFAMLHQVGGKLYNPSSTSVVSEMIENETARLRRLQSYCYALPVSDLRFRSTMVLDVNILDSVSSDLPSLDLALVGRNFLRAIENANKTDLVTRGPLDLKSPNIVPPQIVLDQEGHLAVFTGRGCGTTRDVNFFRPTNGGDTEVDVNDVSYTLQKVIELRRTEETWHVDSFGGVMVAPLRPPDEAIVLCLDLSESMNKQSGISQGSKGDGVPEEPEYDHQTASFDLLKELALNVSEDVVLDNARRYLRDQHLSCHHAWKCYLQGGSGKSLLVYRLLRSLGSMARRDVLELSLSNVSGSSSFLNEKMLVMAHFAIACDQQTTELAQFITELLDALKDGEDVGAEPYLVPRRLIDPKTGDLLLNPVLFEGMQNIFINEGSRAYFASQRPTGPFILYNPQFSNAEQVKRTVTEWISGQDLTPVKHAPSFWAPSKTMMGENDIQVTLVHEGETTIWDLSVDTPTRTLYCLVYRATKARYARFTLRLASSKVVINDWPNRTIGVTDLSHGGEIELCMAFPHNRGLSEIVVRDPYQATVGRVLLPRDAPVLALIAYLEATGFGKMTDMQLWHGIKPAGDGVMRGEIVKNIHVLSSFGYSYTQYEFDCYDWSWRNADGLSSQKETSRCLNRLHVLKELFNVFINRACSFDTSVSLVLGLVTFSDRSTIEQELTAVFENFVQRLDNVFAKGDTAVYDALDTARKMLLNYRTDLPRLRKRIIIVSDGADTGSKMSAHEVCRDLQRNGIIVDSVQVGDKSDNSLHAISVATGGYRFCPQTSLSDALSIFDLETMLSSAERTPRSARPLVTHHIALSRYASTRYYPIDIITISRFPDRAPHVKLGESVQPVSKLISASTNDSRSVRIMRELKDLTADPHPQLDLYVNDSDISFLKMILEAPKNDTDCPWSNGTFLLTCDIPQTYPRDPPEIRFVTFILHPNVSKQGKVCIAELGRLWSSDITLKEIFSLIYGLLLDPDLENPLDIQASLKYYDDDGTFALAVTEAVAEHASKSREEWRIELEEV